MYELFALSGLGLFDWYFSIPGIIWQFLILAMIIAATVCVHPRGMRCDVAAGQMGRAPC